MFGDLRRRQHGVVSRAEVLACGLTDKAIESRLRSGRWQRLYTGIFATFSGEIPRLSQLWAAALRAGDGAVLSHSSAAEVAGLAVASSSRGPIHVTVPTTHRVQRIPGVVVHRSSRLETARHPTLLPPQTRIEETVIDLTQTARTLEEAMSWIARAVGERRTTIGRLGAALTRRQRAQWRAELVHALRDVASGCHSLIELRYLRDVERAHGLPVGERQVSSVRGLRKVYHDVLYKQFGTIVELDGQAAHPDAERWRDMDRDNAAVVEGNSVLRYGTGEVVGTPCHLAVQVATVLRGNGWQGAPTACGPTCVITESVPPQREEDPPRRRTVGRRQAERRISDTARAAP